MQPELTSQFRASAIARTANAQGAFAAIARRGDDVAGTINIMVVMGNVGYLLGEHRLFDGTKIFAPKGPSVGIGPDNLASGIGLIPIADLDAHLAKDARFDPDFWVIEIEDKKGRHFADLNVHWSTKSF